jgi:hypothetical protein
MHICQAHNHYISQGKKKKTRVADYFSNNSSFCMIQTHNTSDGANLTRLPKSEESFD